MPTELELVETSFGHEATIEGLCDEAWRLLCDIADMKKQYANLERILLEHCVKTGEVIQGRERNARARRRLRDVREGKAIWINELAWERKGSQ